MTKEEAIALINARRVEASCEILALQAEYDADFFEKCFDIEIHREIAVKLRREYAAKARAIALAFGIDRGSIQALLNSASIHDR